MRQRIIVGRIVIAAAVAVFATTAVCPAQCLPRASETLPAAPCHDASDAPPPSGSGITCCPALVAAQAATPPLPVSLAAIPGTLLRAMGAMPPAVSKSFRTRAHSPPPIYIRDLSLQI